MSLCQDLLCEVDIPTQASFSLHELWRCMWADRDGHTGCGSLYWVWEWHSAATFAISALGYVYVCGCLAYAKIRRPWLSNG